MSNQNYEIVKNAEGRYDLIVNGQFVKSYSRKADAQRGYLRMSGCAGAQAGSGNATECATAHLPPASNTGGQTGVGTVSERTTQIVVVNGKAKEIPLRQGSNTAAHIDTLTFTFTKEVLIDHETPLDDKHPENVRELAEKLSSTMHTLFGFGISEQKNGINGYKYSFVMGSHTTKYGVVAFGGSNQKDSIMVHLYGEGLTAAIDGWETRLYNWLDVFAPFAKITRCDLAHDFLTANTRQTKPISHGSRADLTTAAKDRAPDCTVTTGWTTNAPAKPFTSARPTAPSLSVCTTRVASRATTQADGYALSYSFAIAITSYPTTSLSTRAVISRQPIRYAKSCLSNTGTVPQRRSG